MKENFQTSLPLALLSSRPAFLPSVISSGTIGFQDQITSAVVPISKKQVLETPSEVWMVCATKVRISSEKMFYILLTGKNKKQLTTTVTATSATYTRSICLYFATDFRSCGYFIPP